MPKKEVKAELKAKPRANKNAERKKDELNDAEDAALLDEDEDGLESDMIKPIVEESAVIPTSDAE
jgi:hypothetical protein